jgi:hypothetical protein
MAFGRCSYGLMCCESIIEPIHCARHDLLGVTHCYRSQSRHTDHIKRLERSSPTSNHAECAIMKETDFQTQIFQYAGHGCPCKMQPAASANCTSPLSMQHGSMHHITSRGYKLPHPSHSMQFPPQNHTQASLFRSLWGATAQTLLQKAHQPGTHQEIAPILRPSFTHILKPLE